MTQDFTHKFDPILPKLGLSAVLVLYRRLGPRRCSWNTLIVSHTVGDPGHVAARGLAKWPAQIGIDCGVAKET